MEHRSIAMKSCNKWPQYFELICAMHIVAGKELR